MKLRRKYLLASLASICATAFIGGVTNSAPPMWAGGENVMNVELKIGLRSRKYISGFPVPVRATFINKGHRPFCFPGHIAPALLFSKILVLEAATRTAAEPVRAGGARELWNYDAIRDAAPPGHSAQFWEPVYVNRAADVTMPGKYLTRLEDGKIKSNWLPFRVIAPPSRVPGGVPLVYSPSAKGLRWIASDKSVQICVRQETAAGGAHLPLVTVFFRNTARGIIHLRLSGDPFFDFMPRMGGPDGANGDELVKHPHPHWVPIVNKTAVPLTVFGHWLAKQKTPRSLEWRPYSLKPRAVYEYAVPINLGCRFDLSLPGVYRVRVRLAHSKVRSPWAKITVP